MNRSDPPDSLLNDDASEEQLRENLDGDDTSGEPDSEEAIVDGDAIGAGLREEH